ncbi:hypothetical protein RIR_jg35967.t1 [Rhizophagus irregularis DAOM 181602=DAOM 197198]|nr:hypothetical protein RIR_jg35967.t1 [Rhizophagus irregularis DAOM 181602=DAOM 197198]
MEDTSLKTQITKLAHTLQSQEQYIKYLYGVIEELANRQRKNMAAIPPDPITEILNNRTTIANSVAGIRIHLDRTTIGSTPSYKIIYLTLQMIVLMPLSDMLMSCEIL